MLDIKKAFGKNLKLIRKSNNLTQEKLAELIDIFPRQLSKIETGEHFPSAKTLEKICLALNVHPRTLFDFNIEEQIENSKNLYKLIEKFKTVSRDETYTKFVELAIESINDKNALNKLQEMIDVIKLVFEYKKD